jgi:hypothetical protein
VDAKATVCGGKQTRSTIRPGADLQVYINHAFGSETAEQLYGYEPWRLERLRAVEKEWDPYLKSSWYMPVL